MSNYIKPKESIILSSSIKCYVARFGGYYENYPAMTASYNSYEVFRNEENLVRKINDIFKYLFSLIMQLLEEGVKSGELSSTIDCKNLSDIILGTCREITLKWRIRNYNFKLKERLTSTWI